MTFGETLRKMIGPEEMKRWEIKRKNDLIEFVCKRTRQKREDVIRAIKNSKRGWWNLSFAEQQKECGNNYGFFGCPCDGDIDKCPHSHAYMDIVWEVDENGIITTIEDRAKICEKWQERKAETTTNDRESRDTVYNRRKQ